MINNKLSISEDPDYDQTTQAITTEWLVSFLRWVVLAVFTFIRSFIGTEYVINLQPLYFFILLGVLYNIYVTYILYSGLVYRNLHRYISFFLFTDILLLITLVYFSNIYEQGLLTFYLFLIIIVALRSSLKLSLILGPIMVFAYIFSSYLVAGLDFFNTRRMILDVIGLLSLTAFCGWFSEGKSRAFQLINQLSQKQNLVSQDLDETRRQLELYRKLEEIRKNFIASMSHELRTPLTGIIGYTDYMLMEEAGPINENQQKFLKEISQKSDSLLRLIDNLLDLSKIQSGRWALRLEQVSPKSMIDSVVSNMQTFAKKKGIDIVYKPSMDNYIPDIIADRENIERVLNNLIGNAVKFIPNGGKIHVNDELSLSSSLNEYFPYLISSTEVVTFSVADNGPGISPEDQKHIFERFYHRQKESGGVLPKGVGLGLSIAKEIVNLHWGKIWYEDTPGGGCTFRFSLPVNPLRLCRKILLIKSKFYLGFIMEGLLIQFDEEIEQKKLTIQRQGWANLEGRTLIVYADRQLIQCVFFNILNNQINHAFPESEIKIALMVNTKLNHIVIRFENEGDLMDPEIVDQLRKGNIEGDELSQDLRRADVNLTLARDIIESHGGTFILENIKNKGVALTISLPMYIETVEKGDRYEVQKNLNR